jgi:VRR-NUC domain
VKSIPVSEDNFRGTVVEAARRSGWSVFTIPDWMYRAAFRAWKQTGDRWGREWPDRGFPDLVLLRVPRLVFVELKGSGGRLSENQKEWIEGLRECGQDVRVWWPKDWDEIEELLSVHVDE